MSVKRKIQIIIDICMTILLPVLMAYVLVGEEVHEWIGSTMFLLFIVHHILNRSWLKNIRKGKYNGMRILGTVINVCLLIIMITLMISGIMVSKYVYSFLPLGGGMSTARIAHLLASNWGFVMMSLHLGLHWSMFLGMVRKARKGKDLHIIETVALRGFAALISAYGIYAFYRRNIGSYLFLTNQFVFFDYHEPFIYFLIDYFAMTGLFACLGYYLSKTLKSAKNK